MSVKRDDSFVIIAPVGTEYSTIYDADFDLIQQNYKIFTELTFQQYCDWVYLRNRIVGRSERTGAGARPTVSANLRRYQERRQWTGTGTSYTGQDVLVDFDGFYPSYYNTSTAPTGLRLSLSGTGFSISGEDRIASLAVNSGSFTISNETYLIDGGAADIRHFYHRNKFYVYLQFRPYWESDRIKFTFTATPTLLSWKETNYRSDKVTVSHTRTYSYELQPN
jgi:hypothetical protein